jgi:hypothetical protein
VAVWTLRMGFNAPVGANMGGLPLPILAKGSPRH